MILDSFDHAEDDFAKRLLIEARNEAETILSAVERAPQSPAWQQLRGEEQGAITARVTGWHRSSRVKTRPPSAMPPWRSIRPRVALPN